MKSVGAILIVLFIGFSPCLAQQSAIELQLDTNQILIGQQALLTISAKIHAADKVVFPAFQDTLMDMVEIVKKSGIDTSYNEENLEEKTLKETLTLTSFDSGYYVVKPMVVLVNGDSVWSNPLLLTVMTVPVDTAAGFMDIKQPLDVPFNIQSWLSAYWPWLVGGVLAVGLIVFLLWYFKKRKPETIIEAPKEPALPAHEQALKELAALEVRKLWQQDKTKMYYSELTDILRRYIETRFHVSAMELTSGELLQSLRGILSTESQKLALQQVFHLADLAKFAKEKPIANENESCMRYARQFINDTKPTKDI